jgi:DNA-3-methyladenine glycosylase II
VGNTKARAARPKPLHRIIAADSDVLDGVRALRRKCAIMRRVHDFAGDPPLRRRPAGFEGLARIVVGQQVSVASATAIWERTAAACTPFEAPVLLALNDATACAGGLDLTRLDGLSEEEIHDALTEIVGIGPWTADVFILFCLGRADGWAPGDLALQVAVQRALELGERPGKEEMTEIAERWRPWRGVAARLLWAYYAALKQRAALPV